MRMLTLVAFGALAFAPSLASAQGTEEQRAACQPDAARFCQQVGTDRQRVAQCLGQNFRRLSPACRQVMKFGTVQNVCAAQIARYCGSAGGSIQATLACLKTSPTPPNCRNAVRAALR